VTTTPLQRLERAEEALRAARHLLDGGFERDCVNRAHLAMELGALAMLATKGLMSKSHTGVQTLFYDHIAKPGLLPRCCPSLKPEPRPIETAVP
jgi:uncharacterized protein (UPF0332 family)